MEQYSIELQKFGESNNIIGFIIRYKNYEREYPSFLCPDNMFFVDFINDKKKAFIEEVNEYRKPPKMIRI